MGIAITVILALILAYFLVDILVTLFAGACIICRYLRNHYRLTHS